MPSIDFDAQAVANGVCEHDNSRGGWRRQVHRFGAWLGSCDRYYRVTLDHARRKLGRSDSHFREWAFFTALGLAIEVAAIGAGFAYFWKADCEHQRIVEQRQRQEQRQRELDRQSYFVRMDVEGITRSRRP